ncbi:MAG: VCBS repeat-containing protein [Planctomycetota bacterium]|nr:VCBS repeat-containing protein [Planctomycetota bacterium]
MKRLTGIGAVLLAAGTTFAQQRAADVEDLLGRRDAVEDDWQSEHASEAAMEHLRALASALGADRSAGGLDPATFAAPDFEATLIRVGEAESEDRDALRVERWRAPGPDAGRVGLVEFLREWMEPLAEADEVQLHFKIVAVRMGEPGAPFETDVLIDASGREGEAVIAFTGEWIVRWDSGATEEVGTRMVGVDPRRLDLVRVERPLFRERTRALVGEAGGATDLLADGCGFWHGRIDDLGEPNFWGHNGLAVGDVNGDGLEDLYVGTGTGLPNMLFVQNADGSVTERAKEAGCAWLDDTKGVLLIDHDNDGDRDLFCAIGPSIVLSTNDGEGNFTPARRMRASSAAGFYSLAASDFDLDGDLDLYAVRYVKTSYGDSVPIPLHDAHNGPRNHLLRNDGEDGFKDVTDEVGLGIENDRFSLAASWCDFDLDGDPDLYVANDFGRNNLYRNDGGHFEDVAGEAGCEDQAAGMGVSWADADGDGDPDLLVSNMYSSAGRRITYQPRFKREAEGLRAELRRHALGNSLFLNRGDGTFEDASSAAGVRMGRWACGALFSDFDGDGRPDMVVPNGFLTNSDPQDL